MRERQRRYEQTDKGRATKRRYWYSRGINNRRLQRLAARRERLESDTSI